MAEMNIGDGIQTEIERKGYISICDPCIGAGAMLIAAANVMKRVNVNYQTCAVLVGQDVDRVVAMMAYIQLSLLGCAGYIIVGDSLKDPPTGHVLFPRDREGQEIWIMPMFLHKVWELRRTGILIQELFRGPATTEKTGEKEHFFMFFDFEKKEANYGD